MQRKNVSIKILHIKGQWVLLNENWDYLLRIWFPSTSESVEINGNYSVDWDDWSWPSKGNKFVSTEQSKGGKRMESG